MALNKGGCREVEKEKKLEPNLNSNFRTKKNELRKKKLKPLAVRLFLKQTLADLTFSLVIQARQECTCTHTYMCVCMYICVCVKCDVSGMNITHKHTHIQTHTTHIILYMCVYVHVYMYVWINV
jgi:hypothetical protein